MARRQGVFDDLMHIGVKLQWRAAVLFAAGSFLVFHFLAISTSARAATTTLAGLGNVVGHQLTPYVRAVLAISRPGRALNWRHHWLL